MRLCWRCWRAQKDLEALEKAFRQGFDEGYRAAARDHGRARFQRPQPTAFDGELLRRAISLCHPDRHPPERAGEANAVTAELLALRSDLAA